MRIFSISAVAAAIAFSFSAGCSTVKEVEFDARRPSIEITDNGGLKFGDRFVTPEEVPDILEAHEVPHDRTIHILLSREYTDLRGPRIFMGLLAKRGYTRSVLVYKRHVETSAHDTEPQGYGAKKNSTGRQAKPFRMKGADE